MTELDETVCKQMEGLVELLTTSGKSMLNPEIMKKFKKICRISDGYVQHAFTLLMSQLEVKHSEVRLSAYQMVDELFNRSHMFRELLLEDFDTFLELTAGTDKKKPLPAPKVAADNMKNSVLRSVLLWYEKFGEAYKKLALGYEFLRNCKNVDFDSIQATVELERRQKEETERKLEEQRKEKLDQVSKEYSEHEFDIQLCITEVENGLQLLMPRPDDFFISLTSETGTSRNSNHTVTSSMMSSKMTPEFLDINNSVEKETSESDNKKFIYNQAGDQNESLTGNLPHSENCKTTSVNISSNSVSNCEDDHESDDDDESDFEDFDSNQHGVFTQEHGLFDRKFALTVKLNQPGTSLQETEDNQDLIQGVRDQYRLIKSKYLPAVKKWLQVMSDNQAATEKIVEMTTVKSKLEEALKKCVELEIASSKHNQDESDSDEEDFEDVPDKEGYEEDVPEHVRMEAVMTSKSQSSRSKTKEKKLKSTNKPKDHAKTQTARTKKIKKMAQDLLDSQRLLDVDDVDSALLKSQVMKTKSDHRIELFGNDNNLPSTSCFTVEDKAGKQSNIQSQSNKPNNNKSKDNKPRDNKPKEEIQPKDKIERKSSLLEKAPVVSFGLDLEHWENPDKIKVPVKNKFEEASRFWVQEKDVDDEQPGSSEEVAALTRRTVTYVGEFQPVKWKCRAPLQNGKLCERMDREKCPFHGKIIGRDSTGQPTDPEASSKLNRQKLLAEAEGQDSDDSSPKSKGKGQGKSKERAKKRKYPNLTDIKESNDNSRSRLEAKIFNRSTLRKVNKVLDAAAMKKLSEKFGNQFNYCLK